MSETEDYDKSATPTAHKTSHQDGGSDEIAVTGLAGLLADGQTPLAHKTSHQDGGTDEILVEGLAGELTAEQKSAWAKVSGKPTTFAPEAHKTSHQDAGADEISVTGLSGELTDLQKPKDHTHQSAGSGVGGKIDHGLALDGLGDDDHTQYIKHALATAESDFLAASGSGAFVKKTLAETKTILGISGAADPGEGHITLFLYNYNSIGQGTWTILPDANQFLYGSIYNSSISDGDNISLKVYLAAGTYTLRILWIKFSVAGKLDIDIDDVEVASLDWYAAVTAYNSFLTQTGIVIATSGIKTIKFRAHGSTGGGYYVGATTVALWRTA